MPGEDATDITHESISVPVNNANSIFRTQISHQPLNTVVPPTNTTVPDQEGSSTDNSTSAIYPTDEIRQQQQENPIPSPADSGYHSSSSFFPPEVQQAEQPEA